MPRCVTDADLENVAKFRSVRRVPSVVWRNPVNGAVLARSSQPEVSLMEYHARSKLAPVCMFA